MELPRYMELSGVWNSSIYSLELQLISFIKNGVVTGESFSNEDEQIQLVDSRKLSSIYQFALAMPLLFVPAAHTKACDKKRKRIK